MDAAHDAVPRRRRYLHLGALLTSVSSAAALVYVLSTPERPHRTLVVAGVAAASTLGAAVGVLAGRIASWRYAQIVFYAWSAVTLVLILTAAALDGGIESPFTALLVLPVAYASLQYPVKAVRLLVMATSAGMALLMVTGDGWSADGLIDALVVGLFGLLAVMGAGDRRALEEAERELVKRATHDALTGCLTQGAFHDELTREEARVRRHGGVFSVVIIDVDVFKAVNDAYGHATGDAVLRRLGATLRESARADDVVGRLGGDEFAVLLVGTDQRHAVGWSERVRAAVHRQSEPLPITISLGLATWRGNDRGEGDSARHILRRADNALYRAKHAGRDRLAVA